MSLLEGMDKSIREKFSKSLFINEVRKWEDLHTDCLVKIFATVDIESLIVHLPLVCKSWYKASLDPLCWKFLDFEYLHLATNFGRSRSFIRDGKLFRTQNLCAKQAIKYAVKSSCGVATEVAFPKSLVHANILQYVLERCPALKCLTLPYKFTDQHLENELICVPKLINKWKDLESLKLSSDYYFEEILTQINIHCKKFVSLTVEAHQLTEQVASAIVTFVPNIKYLEISSFFLHRDDLMLILSGCRKLEVLDLNECLGNFNTNDAEIVAMTSHIETFKSGRSGKLPNIELIENGHLPLRLVFEEFLLELEDMDDERIREIFSKDVFVNEVRKWEDMHTDCLVKIFEKMGIDSLILHLPFVCKSWYEATLDPQCWKILDFGYLEKKLEEVDKEVNCDMIKFAVDRSCGKASKVIFPDIFDENILQYVLGGCAKLKSLVLPWFDESTCIPEQIHKLKDMKSLSLDSSCHLKEILTEIHSHCNKFVSLTVTDYSYMSDEEASAIVTFVPDIKQLVLSHCHLTRENLILILSGCRRLELLDVTHCIGFDAEDAEILSKASHIKIFKPLGSVAVKYDSEFSDYSVSYSDIDYYDDSDYDIAS